MRRYQYQTILILDTMFLNLKTKLLFAFETDWMASFRRKNVIMLWIYREVYWIHIRSSWRFNQAKVCFSIYACMHLISSQFSNMKKSWSCYIVIVLRNARKLYRRWCTPQQEFLIYRNCVILGLCLQKNMRILLNHT